MQLDGLGCVDLRKASVAGLELLSGKLNTVEDKLNLKPVKNPVKTKGAKLR